MQLIKPRCLGLISKTYGLGELQMAIGALSFFSLEEGGKLLMECEQWPAILASLGDSQVLDMGYAKPAGEVLVSGNVHAAGNQAVTQCRAGIKLGRVNKALTVVGDRNWHRGWFSRVSQSIPFTQMPLTYARAFGGQGFDENPLGVGSKKALPVTKNCWPLPNFYYSEDSLNPGQFPVKVAGFGSIDISYPQRTQYQGSYDQQWLLDVHPGFPHDTDPRLFNSAPEDQQLSGYIEPDSEFILSGFHPRHYRIQSCLPNMRVRVVVQQEVDKQLCYRDLTSQIDTLWLFPEQMLGVAIHRASVAVNDIDGLDIKQLLLAYEGADDIPRPLAHYTEQLEQRTQPSSAVNSLLNEAPLLAEKSPEQLQRRERFLQQAQQEYKQRKQQMRNKLLEQQPFLATVQSEEDDETDELAAIPPQLLAEFDFDLSPVIEKTKALSDQAKAEAEQLMESAKNLTATAVEPETLEQLQRRVKLPAQIVTSGSEASPVKIAEQSLVDSKRHMRQLSPQNTQVFLPLNEINSRQIRLWVEEILRQKGSLAGRDFAGADLSYLDFSGQDLSNVMFECCNLQGCNFVGCQMSGTVLTQANITDADFTRTKLIKANLSGVTGQDTNFTQASISQSAMIKADLTQPNFSQVNFSAVNAIGSRLEQGCFLQATFADVQLVQCSLSHSLWQGANLDACVMFEADLQFSRWPDAKLHRCMLLAAKLQHSEWGGADCKLLQLGPQGYWNGADLSRSKWHTCGFRQLDLQGCNAENAMFIECDFSAACWQQASLRNSTFYACLMGDISLDSLDWRDSFLYQSNLRKVKASKVDWQNSRFNEVDIDQGQFTECHTQGMSHSPAPKHAISMQEN